MRALPRIEDIWYGDAPGGALARRMLAPMSAVFGAAVSVRGRLYDLGLLRARTAPAPVLSVGGLSVGGSGKTPMVIWLARRLRAEGLRPCIVTRGYGGTSDGSPMVLRATDAATDTIVDRAGDEAVLIALRSGCPVAVAHDRLAGCETAHAKLVANGEPPGVFVLDDGFQHRSLARDLDIVMTTGSESALGLLPGGPLREPLAALARADAIVSTGAGPDPPLRAIDAASTPLAVRAAIRPTLLVGDVSEETGDSVAWLAGRNVVAVAAIARPERFLADLESAGARIAARVLRRDHHRYGQDDGREIDAALARLDGAVVVTTEKDLVKLVHLRPRLPMRALRVELRIDRPADEAALVRLSIARATRPGRTGR